MASDTDNEYEEMWKKMTEQQREMQRKETLAVCVQPCARGHAGTVFWGAVFSDHTSS